MTAAMLVGGMGVALAAISAWLAIKGKCGDGWALMAFVLIVTSCAKA